MTEFTLKEGHENLILFVHGFGGDADTWKNSNGDSFPSLLALNEEIASNYDIATFSYYTKLLNLFSKGKNAATFMQKMFKTSHGKLKKNISVEEIAALLRAELRFRLHNYDNVIVIAHSMGGLVAKSAIMQDIAEGQISRVKLYISLAVPHQGAEIATFVKQISKNVQTAELAPLNDFLSKLNDSWLKTSIRPTSKYFYGVHDSIVPKTSAVPADKDKLDSIPVDEDHQSIAKPEDDQSTTFLAVLNCVLGYEKGDIGLSNFEYQKIANDDDFNDELFVLKLISADIHDSSVRQAKELYLNAEYIRKFFSSNSDQKRLLELYAKIKNIYQTGYTKYIHDGRINSGLLLADVYEQILKEDQSFLKTLLPFINAIHKQGMIHQLANWESENIWWTELKSINLNDIKTPENSDE